MEAAAHRKEIAPEHVVGIVIHVTDALQEQQRNNMVSTLENDDRVVAVDFCPKRCHLVLVSYDRNHNFSADMLDCLTAENVSAKLTGPVQPGKK
jgi:hypothetical protein